MAKTPRRKNPSAEARYLLQRMSITEPPIDVRLIAERSGLEYEEVDYFPDDVDALIITLKGRTPVAVVNKNHSEGRRRFSLAHELYHHLILGEPSVLEGSREPEQPQDREATGGEMSPDERKERDADIFAIDLLMPKALVIKYVRRGTPATEVARLFNVSKRAAENLLRFRQFDLRI